MPRLRTESGARHALKSHVSSAISDTELHNATCRVQHRSLSPPDELARAAWIALDPKILIQLSENFEDYPRVARRPHQPSPKTGRNRGAERDRTDDLRLAKPALSPAELQPRTEQSSAVGQGRVELPTSRLSGVRSNHLSLLARRWVDNATHDQREGNLPRALHQALRLAESPIESRSLKTES